MLSVEGSAALFKGLDAIEQTRGVYRPITLNMMGMVIDRMGATLDEPPERLMHVYLEQCLARGDTRDYARAVLSGMVTDAGTKVPRDEAGLVGLTHLEAWQVESTLRALDRQGLVRRLEGATPVWEIAHDFLARMIGQLIGRLRPSEAVTF